MKKSDSPRSCLPEDLQWSHKLSNKHVLYAYCVPVAKPLPWLWALASVCWREIRKPKWGREPCIQNHEGGMNWTDRSYSRNAGLECSSTQMSTSQFETLQSNPKSSCIIVRTVSTFKALTFYSITESWESFLDHPLEMEEWEAILVIKHSEKTAAPPRTRKVQHYFKFQHGLASSLKNSKAKNKLWPGEVK